jgi:hypothetical protein
MHISKRQRNATYINERIIIIIIIINITIP